jgi:hypothetical protein
MKIWSGLANRYLVCERYLVQISTRAHAIPAEDFGIFLQLFQAKEILIRFQNKSLFFEIEYLLKQITRFLNYI